MRRDGIRPRFFRVGRRAVAFLFQGLHSAELIVSVNCRYFRSFKTCNENAVIKCREQVIRFHNVAEINRHLQHARRIARRHDDRGMWLDGPARANRDMEGPHRGGQHLHRKR